MNLYLVFPEGYLENLAVIVADSEEEALRKGRNQKAIGELVKLGAELRCLDINKGISAQGYSIEVSRLGMYH